MQTPASVLAGGIWRQAANGRPVLAKALELASE